MLDGIFCDLHRKPARANLFTSACIRVKLRPSCQLQQSRSSDSHFSYLDLKFILKELESRSSKRAICLLSGGLDSATSLAIARNQGFECYCLSFDYGQRHAIELRSAALIAQQLQAHEHRTAKIDLRVFGGSALTSDIEVPKQRRPDAMGSEIPVTYVPARNTIFLSFALAYAEVVSASDIFIGVNAVDYSGYPDCRPEFIISFERMANLATKAGVEGSTKTAIHTPLIAMTKADIVRKAVELGVDVGLTHSCYDPDERGRPCGACDSCLLRSKGFEEAGVADPARARDYARALQSSP
jgi:7-cyano-7-deazaguanine synthase